MHYFAAPLAGQCGWLIWAIYLSVCVIRWNLSGFNYATNNRDAQSDAQYEAYREKGQERGGICESSNVIKLCLCLHTNACIAYFSTHAHSHHVLAHNGVLKIDTFVPSNCSVWPKASLVSPLLCAVQPISTSHGSRQSTRGLSWRTTTPCCSIPLFLPWIKMPRYTTLVTPTATNQRVEDEREMGKRSLLLDLFHEFA